MKLEVVTPYPEKEFLENYIQEYVNAKTAKETRRLAPKEISDHNYRARKKFAASWVRENTNLERIMFKSCDSGQDDAFIEAMYACQGYVRCMCYENNYIYMYRVFDTVFKDKLREWETRMRKRGRVTSARAVVKSLGFSQSPFGEPPLFHPVREGDTVSGSVSGTQTR